MLIDITERLIEDWKAIKGVSISCYNSGNLYDTNKGLYKESYPATFKEFIDYVDSNYKTHTQKVFAYESLACDLSSVMLDMDSNEVTGLMLKTAFNGE